MFFTYSHYCHPHYISWFTASYSYDNTWDTNVNQTSGWAHRNNDGRGDTGSARMKGKHFRGLMAFERFIHPYTLMAVGAVGGLVYLGMSTFKKKDRIVNNRVNAWWNTFDFSFSPPVHIFNK